MKMRAATPLALLYLAWFGLASASSFQFEDERDLRGKGKKDSHNAGDLRGCLEEALMSGPTSKKLKPKRYLEEDADGMMSGMKEFLEGYIWGLENRHDEEEMDDYFGNYYDYGEYTERYGFNRGLTESDTCEHIHPDIQRQVSITILNFH